MRTQLLHAAMMVSLCSAGGYSYYHFNPEKAAALARSVCNGEWPPAFSPEVAAATKSAPLAGPSLGVTTPIQAAPAPMQPGVPVVGVTPPQWRPQSSLYMGERLVGMGNTAAAAADSPAMRASRAMFSQSADARSSRAAASRSSGSSRASSSGAGSGGYGRYSTQRQSQRGTYSKSSRYRANSFSSSMSKQFYKKPSFSFTNRSSSRNRRR